MISIALICEGVSEARIISYIVYRYLNDNEVVINNIQPSIVYDNGQEKQDSVGGWAQVLEHCTTETICDAMATNDYLVIQIDTDACIQQSYDVNIYDDNMIKVSDEILYNRVVDRLKRDIDGDIFTQYADKILFAICINETECWLLPLYYASSPKKCSSTTNCIYKLNQKLSTEGMGIPEDNKNAPEVIRVYLKILKNLTHRNIPTVAGHNYGFATFLDQLKKIEDVSTEK